ncbi:adenosylcobinamide-phosphate synthase CbiB [uncultured Tateyamaria sp.]|uniref:adenosylcobinamide-phosphate synthase CbiB n=1 Tax=Tateyamaria sp. 1078 TaxID=3417464 RepID=UPI0026266AB0|nr:adenosylcobinamide-phosphate synthase CbiB [uncultured Tateyamaria sp.]
MSIALQLTLALCLDALLGEPKWLWNRLPHPAVLMGQLVRWLDVTLNRTHVARTTGVVALVVMVTLAGAVGWALSLFGDVVAICAAAILLAHRSLVEHVGAVAAGLRLSDAAGRQAVRMIVSRDVSDAAPQDVARAGIESLAENFSDGVVAPAFWFLVAGLPGIAIYKMVNTADSMIGYRTPRYADFGWAAARCDDVLNWVPARLTALALTLMGGAWHAWAAIRADAALHRSPNAGWPEAALAHSLSFALAGPRSYDGAVQTFPWVNGAGKRALTSSDIDTGVALIWKTWGGIVAALFVLGGLQWLL